MFSLGLSSSAWAQSAKLRIGDGYQCSWTGPGFYTLNVNFYAAGPAAHARFKVVSSSPLPFMDPPNGEFDVSINPCNTYGWLGWVQIFVPAGLTVELTIVPLPGLTEIELTDCDGYALPTVQECETYRQLAPYRPDPPTGAVNVPTNQLLSYVGEANYVALSTNPNMYIWDSTNVILCNHIETGTTGPACQLPLSPGTLAPHTTYYWQAVEYCACGQVYPGYSEVFSFTTGDGPLAVEPSTWGRVKAMYR